KPAVRPPVARAACADLEPVFERAPRDARGLGRHVVVGSLADETGDQVRDFRGQPMTPGHGHLVSSWRKRAASPGSRAGPVYSKPAVRRVVACRRVEPCRPRWASAGARVRRQWGERRRAAMNAGWVVVLVAR